MSSSNQDHREQERPRISAHNAPFAKVVVGPEALSFTVHLDLLIHHSPFFRAALTGSFKEADEKLVTLPDTASNTFELFVHWLYYQRLPIETDSSELLALYRDAEDDEVLYENLVSLYIFCDKYYVPGLKRECLDTLFYQITENPYLSEFNIIRRTFNNLETNRDPLCRLLVDYYCYWASEDCWTLKEVQDLPSTFVAKAMARYTNFKSGGCDAYSLELCDYHGHATSKERKECEKKSQD
ncbi:unnamed protein product [Alternaria sp. RS040]